MGLSGFVVWILWVLQSSSSLIYWSWWKRFAVGWGDFVAWISLLWLLQSASPLTHSSLWKGSPDGWSGCQGNWFSLGVAIITVERVHRHSGPVRFCCLSISFQLDVAISIAFDTPIIVETVRFWVDWSDFVVWASLYVDAAISIPFDTSITVERVHCGLLRLRCLDISSSLGVAITIAFDIFIIMEMVPWWLIRFCCLGIPFSLGVAIITAFDTFITMERVQWRWSGFVLIYLLPVPELVDNGWSPHSSVSNAHLSWSYFSLRRAAFLRSLANLVFRGPDFSHAVKIEKIRTQQND